MIAVKDETALHMLKAEFRNSVPVIVHKRERLRKYTKPAACANENVPLLVAVLLGLRLLGRFLVQEQRN